MSHNPVTGIQIITPNEWAFRRSESWAVRTAASESPAARVRLSVARRRRDATSANVNA